MQLNLKNPTTVSERLTDLHVLLGGHDELVVDDVVGGESHSEEGRGGVQVHRHPRPRVHVLSDPLQTGRLQSHAGRIEKYVLWETEVTKRLRLQCFYKKISESPWKLSKNPQKIPH